VTRVDFYVVPEAEDGPLLTACRLCEKAVTAGKRVHVHAPDAAQAEHLDRLLWTYKQNAFIGHERVGETTEDPSLATVLIGSGEPRATHHDVLVNLAPDVPPFFSRFERVLEIVHGDDATRARSRERFKYYRDRGYTLETHKL